MESGRIIYSGGIEVAGVLEHEGYEGVKKLLEGRKEPAAAWLCAYALENAAAIVRFGPINSIPKGDTRLCLKANGVLRKHISCNVHLSLPWNMSSAACICPPVATWVVAKSIKATHICLIKWITIVRSRLSKVYRCSFSYKWKHFKRSRQPKPKAGAKYHLQLCSHLDGAKWV